MRAVLSLFVVCILAALSSACDTVPACDDPTCPSYVGYLSTDLFVLDVTSSGSVEYRIPAQRGDLVTLIPGTPLVALRGRFVDVATGRVQATFRSIEEAGSGVMGGFVVEERWGGALRTPYRNILVRTIPDHGDEAVRSALTFVGVDGQERTLAGDTLRFVSGATFVRTRHEMPRGSRRASAVLVVRTTEECRLTFDSYERLTHEGCTVTARTLWRFSTDGTLRQPVADLPRTGTVASHVPSADGRHDLVALNTSTGATVVRVNLDTGRTDVHEGLPTPTMGLLPDGVTAFGYDTRLSVRLDMATGVRHVEAHPAVPFGVQTVVQPVGVVADHGLVVLGWDSQHGAVGVLTVPVPSPPGDAGVVRRLFRDESLGMVSRDVFSQFVQGAAAEDGTRYAMVIERHGVRVYID